MIERLRVRIPAEAAGEFSSPEIILFADSYWMLTQWHVKDPGHSAKRASGRLHVDTHTPLTQRSRSGLTMPLSGHSVGTYSVCHIIETIMPRHSDETCKGTSSHATCLGTFGHSCLKSPSHCGLILT